MLLWILVNLFKEIKCTEISRHFTCLSFTYYDGKMNSVEHVSHFTQLMALYSQNNGLLCKAFSSSLDLMAM